MGVPCLDEGSTPSNSTNFNLLKNKTADYQLVSSFLFFIPCYILLFFVQNLRKLWRLKKRILKYNYNIRNIKSLVKNLIFVVEKTVTL